MSVLIFFGVIFATVVAVKVALFFSSPRPYDFMPWKYTDGGRSASGFRTSSRGDCVTRALAIVTAKPYREVFETVNEFGAAERRSLSRSSANGGVYPRTMRRLMEHYGGVWVPHELELREGEFPEGRIVVKLNKHVAAVINGVVYDSHDPQQAGNRTVQGYWRFP